MSCNHNKTTQFLFRKHLFFSFASAAYLQRKSLYLSLFDCQNLFTANKLIRLQRTRPGDRGINDAAKSTCSETTRHRLGHTRSRHVCNIVKLPPSSVHVSNSGAKSPSGGCSVSGLAGEVNVLVSPIPPAQQSHAENSIHSGGGGDSRSPLMAISVVVSTSTTSLCGTPSSSPLPSGSSVPAGSEVHLRRKVVPSARMEALMRHYKAAGFTA